ncbi:M20 family metallo-hydrolase [Klebsiella sp. NPDC088457]
MKEASLRAARYLDESWLNQLLAQLAGFGKLANGGVDRQALSEVELEARAWLIALARELGCEVYRDAAANLFFRRAGRLPLPPVSTGSHIDTQPCGGNYDGCYGVIAGLACLKALNDAQVETERPIEVVIWTNEEGSRFAPGAMGSSAFVDPARLARYLVTVGEDGVPFREALARHQQRFADIPQRPNREMAGFVELHIEQGPVLEARDLSLAVVQGIQGVRWYQVTCQGISAHAGTTPMTLRQDAMSLARELAARIENAMCDADDTQLRITFGRWQITPNAINTIPSCVSFTLDFRHPARETLARLDTLMAGLVCERVNVDALLAKAPVTFDPHMNHVLKNAGNALDIAHMELLSGAFHDAMNLAEHCPTSMLFVPSRQGISHNPAEYTDPRSLAAGARTLACALTELSCTIEGVYP